MSRYDTLALIRATIRRHMCGIEDAQMKIGPLAEEILRLFERGPELVKNSKPASSHTQKEEGVSLRAPGPNVD